MKLVVERSGGFAGITRRGERDGSALTSEQRAALQKLLERSSDFPPDAGADRFNYRVEVQDDNGTKRITVPESAMPRVLKEIATE
jgi:emfourin